MSVGGKGDWLSLDGLDRVDSPGLLIDLDRVQANIETMIRTVGGDPLVDHHVDPHADHPKDPLIDRLRPHVKTNKCSTIIRMLVDAGITRFKAATIAEAGVVAIAGGCDVLLAHQPVGVKAELLRQLMSDYPQTTFSTIVDDAAILHDFQRILGNADRPFPLWIDVDCGMHRTGIALGPKAAELQQRIEESPTLRFAGLHVYDGHVHDSSLEIRQQRVDRILESVRAYTSKHPCPAVICGGSPTFGLYAEQTDYQCSPGTMVLWDTGYANAYQEMSYQIAAALVTRVISRPSERTWCLDLGHKAVASEMPLDARVTLPLVPDAKFLGHSEEHLVIETDCDLMIGQALVALPKHICPTVALHASATIVENGRVTERTIPIDARDR